MAARIQRRRHLRDAANVCPATLALSGGLVISRCERDAGHDGQHRDGCTLWGPSVPSSNAGLEGVSGV